MDEKKKYIDIDELKDELESELSPMVFNFICNTVIDQMPAADVAPVVHGEWQDKQNPRWKAYDIRHCSVCGWNIPKTRLRNKDLHWNHCPNCGAKMDGGQG